ncbi:MAG TPA: hypothetical protein VGN37_22820 [Actinocatenispora sp.]
MYPTDELARWRGGFPRAALTARRVAGLLEVPGCARREALDTAELPIAAVAALLGCPPAHRSPYAHARQRRFETACTADDLAALLDPVRDVLGVPVTHGRIREIPAGTDEARADATRAALADAPADAVTLLRAPVLPLRLGDRTTHLSYEVLIVAGHGPLHVVEPRPFPCVDGVADPAQVAAAARQVAVTVLALRGYAETAERALLVLPENFSLRPTGAALDVAPQVRRLAALLPTLGAAGVGDAPTLPDPTAVDAADRVAAAVGALGHRFGDGCLGCDLFGFCRAGEDARGAVTRLGTAAANTCGTVATVTDALGLADGSRTPHGPAETALADGLSRAARALALADTP